MKFIYVFLGGGAGALSRYIFGIILSRFSTFPIATLTVNVTGSFLIGLLVFLFSARDNSFIYWRELLIIGFLGGFTTFSSFSMETVSLFHSREFLPAMLNIAANIFLCLAAAYGGIYLAKQLI